VIAVALLNGQGADDIARDRRKGVETIRWHIRNMADKAGCSGAQGLTRMLSLLLPA
jgi:DNA-binding CsgD family transcriptional regulator